MSEPIRTIIADDEPLARRQIRALLERDAQIALLAEAATGQEARRAIAQWQPELLLLDIRMPQGDGFQVLADLAQPPYVIFATAHAEHAVRAFDVEAVDYLLKPFDDERFERAIQRAKDAIRARRLVQLAQDIATTRPVTAEAPEARLALHEGRRVTWMPLAEIEWVEAADYYVQVHAQGRSHLLREPLQSLEARLGNGFLRVHRNALVNVARITRLERQEHGELVLVLASGSRVTVSRARRARVSRALIRR